MAKYQYISIWKDEGFWKRIVEISTTIIGLFIFFHEFFKGIDKYYYLIALGLTASSLMFSSIADVVNEEIEYIKKTLYWQVIINLIPIVVYIILVQYFTDYFKSFLYVYFAWSILFLILKQIFKKRISNGALKYIFSYSPNKKTDDNPVVFSKRWFKEESRGTIIGVCVFSLYLLAIFVMAIGFLFFNWNIASIIH